MGFDVQPSNFSNGNEIRFEASGVNGGGCDEGAAAPQLSATPATSPSMQLATASSAEDNGVRHHRPSSRDNSVVKAVLEIMS